MRVRDVVHRAAVTAALLVTSALPVTGSPASADVGGPSTTITGRGAGPGVGLSQYGTLARLADGQSWTDVLGFYFPGTQWGSVTRSIRVWLRSDGTTDVRVRPRSGLTVRWVRERRARRLPTTVHGRAITAWRIMPARSRWSKVELKAGRWREWRRAPGEAEFAAGGAPITLVAPRGATAYRGRLRSAMTGPRGWRRETVNIVSLEDYLRGVVPGQMPPGWPAEALQAQAVAARSYAAHRWFPRSEHPFDTCDTPGCPVYGGYDAEDPRTDAAVRATAHQVLTFDGEPAQTTYTLSNGGFTAGVGGLPYLPAQEDPYDHGVPGDPWSRTLDASQIESHWPGIGDLVSVTVSRRDASGRATQMIVKGSEETVYPAAADFVWYFDLPSALFDVS